MPERETIHRELNKHRDNAQKLIQEQLPETRQLHVRRLLHGGDRPDAVPEVHGELHLEDVEHPRRRAADVHGLGRSVSSRLHQDRREERRPRGLGGYDPIKFEDHTLGKGIRFQVYPKGGWNEVWNAMVARSTVVRDRVVGIRDEHKQPYVLMASGEKHYFADYHTVFCSIDIDDLWGEDTLPYTGRMMIPLLIPGLEGAFPGGAESLHYSSCEFQTRVTEMKVITRHESPDTLILIEVPVLPGAAQCFPKNTIDYALENNLFTEKAYPQQSEQAFATYHAYVDRGKKIPEPALRRPPRRVQVLGNAGDGEFRLSEGAGISGGLMSRRRSLPRVLASTTSHKREPLLPTLEVFSRLGLRDIDLNLHHILEEGVAVESVAELRRGPRSSHLDRVGRMVRFLPGRRRKRRNRSVGGAAGRYRAPARRGTTPAVFRPAEVRGLLAARPRHRLPEPVAIIGPSSRHALQLRKPRRRLAPSGGVPGHPGAGRPAEHPDELRSDQLRARRRELPDGARLVHPFVGHVHLKGLEHGEFCEFGVGDVDLTPVLRALDRPRYRGGFSVEYEGPHDGTLRLYQSVQRARSRRCSNRNYQLAEIGHSLFRSPYGRHRKPSWCARAALSSACR